ncbi:gag-pol polyprotein, partial [Trifolium medium]|nr:gag-pol polyprotein [Trifolium medium]
SDKHREPRGPPSMFSSYTPLISSREHILSECAASEFRQGGIKFPKQVPAKPHQDTSKWCRYHKAHGHVTEECIHLKDAIEILIRDGHLKRFVQKKNPRSEHHETSAVEEEKPASSGQDVKQVAMCIWGPEDFYVPEVISAEFTALSHWENFPQAMVISGGGYNKITIGSVKRKFEELIDASSNLTTSLDKTKDGSLPFYREELPGT